MRTVVVTNNDGIDIDVVEFESVDEAIEERGEHKVLGMINAVERRNTTVNAGRQQKADILKAALADPDFRAKHGL